MDTWHVHQHKGAPAHANTCRKVLMHNLILSPEVGQRPELRELRASLVYGYVMDSRLAKTIEKDTVSR